MSAAGAGLLGKLSVGDCPHPHQNEVRPEQVPTGAHSGDTPLPLDAADADARAQVDPVTAMQLGEVATQPITQRRPQPLDLGAEFVKRYRLLLQRHHLPHDASGQEFGVGGEAVGSLSLMNRSRDPAPHSVDLPSRRLSYVLAPDMAPLRAGLQVTHDPSPPVVRAAGSQAGSWRIHGVTPRRGGRRSGVGVESVPRPVSHGHSRAH